MDLAGLFDVAFSGFMLLLFAMSACASLIAGCACLCAESTEKLPYQRLESESSSRESSGRHTRERRPSHERPRESSNSPQYSPLGLRPAVSVSAAPPPLQIPAPAAKPPPVPMPQLQIPVLPVLEATADRDAAEVERLRERIRAGYCLYGPEMELLEQLVHPGITQIYELLHDDEFYYIVSELVADGTLFDYLVEQTETKYGAIPEANAKVIITQIL